MIKHLFSATLFVLFLLPYAAAPFAQTPDLKILTEFAREGDNVLAATRYKIPPDYHAYANKPGGTGLPTKLDFTLEGEGSMPTLYPAGDPEPDPFSPKITINAYNGEITLLTVLPSDSAGKMYVASLDMLLCSSRNCLPFKETLSGQTPNAFPPLSGVSWATAAKNLLAGEGASLGALSLEEGSAPPPLAETGAKAVPTETAGAGLVNAPEDFDLNLKPQYADSSVEIYSLGQALLLGLIAGLLLNAMPCVLPVLTMKVSGLLLMGDADNPGQLRAFRRHNIWFASGVLTFFTFLALILGALDMMWGQLYQNETVILLMLLMVFLMGLSMLGVFNLPAFDLKLGANVKNPDAHSFVTGFVSTFLATPCSGPLLGGALAWAFSQPLPVLLAVFWAIGIGMALPYFVFSVWPGLVKILPHPGAWMYLLERSLGFLLLGTALYLLTILPQDKRVGVLTVLLIVAAGAWLWGKFCGLDAPPLRRKISGVAGVLAVGLAIFWILKPPAPGLQWRSFSPEDFASALGKRNMLVEFTADWCPNCKFLESTVLSGKSMRGLQKNYDLELVRVDLTRDDPYGQRLLQMLGSKSIPLTAIFPQGPDASRPMVLRDVYGKKTLDKALSETLDGA